MKFRKKPVVIDAFCLKVCGPKPAWFLDAKRDGTVRVYAGDACDPFDGKLTHAEIDTLEGTHRANLGDWIIQGVKGELYPCKPDIFEMTYEEVE